VSAVNYKRIFSIVLVTATLEVACAVTPKPKILVYSYDMPGLGRGVAEILSRRIGGWADLVLLNDPSDLSALISMPEVGCVVLAVMSGNEVKTLVDPLLAYFSQGGAVVGFQGCCVEQQVGALARDVFPAFGNATGSGSLKAGIPVNEYVRDQYLEAFGDLPGQFDLLGQFFPYCANASRSAIDPEVAEGSRIVLYRESRTNAPLIIAYEGPKGSRSVSLTGCFVRSKVTEKNYYGNLLEDPVFQTLLADAVNWTMQGATRHRRYGSSIGEMVRQDAERREALRSHALKVKKDRQMRKQATLLAGWAVGLLFVAGLLHWAFRGKPLRPLS